MKTKQTKANREPIHFLETAASVIYQSIAGERGWWVREYHSPYVMKAHLKHLKTGAPPPRHFGKAFCWEMGFAETGPFTKQEAMGYALEPITWEMREAYDARH